MESRQVTEVFNKVGALITESHIVYASGRHGTDYVDKDRVGTDPIALSLLAAAMACEIRHIEPDVIVSPAVGAIALGQILAFHLSPFVKEEKRNSVKFVIADKEVVAIDDPEGKGRKCFYQTGNFVLRPKDDSLIKGKRVVTCEDILTTGATAKKVIEAVRKSGGEVVMLAALVNRGGVTKEDVGNPGELFALLNLSLPSFTEEECALNGPCSRGVPINTTVGKGNEFLRRKNLNEKQK